MPFPRWLRSPHIAPLLVLAALALTFCWPIFVPRWHMPAGGGDLLALLYPLYTHAADSLRSAQLPLWNPYLYSGAPFLADPQTSLFYPPNLLFLLFPAPPYALMELLVAFHLWLAGAGVYTLLTLRGLPRLPAVTGALTFMFSSVFVTHIGNLNILAASAYLPWAIASWDRLAHHTAAGQRIPAIRAALALAVTLTLSFFAGQAQFTWITLIALTFFAAADLIHHPHRLTLLAYGVAAALVTLGLSAAQLLPTLELTQHTARAALAFDEVTRWSLPWPALTEFISPLLFGRGADAYWAVWDRAEFGYAGLTALTLALFTLYQPKPHTRLYLLFALGLLLALGRYTPLYQLLYTLVPTFDQFRAPARFVLLADFALALLAAHGLHALLTAPPTRDRWLTILAALFIVIVLSLPIAHSFAAADLRTLGATAANTLPFALTLTLALLFIIAVVLAFRRPAALPILLALELLALGAWVETSRFDPTAGFTPGPAVEWLQQQPGPFRIDVASGPWQPDAPRLFGLEAIGGLSNPLALAAYDAYYWSVGYRGSPQYNLLNAQFLITAKDQPAADASFIPVFNADPAVDVYLNTNAQPRIRLLYNTHLAPSPDAAFTALHDGSVDLLTTVILTDPTAPPVQPTDQPANLFYTVYTPTRHVVAVTTPAPAYLVLAEVWYPGWQATLDGQPTPIYRANTAFRAVYVPAGEHTLEFVYRPTTVTLGLALSALTFIIVTLVCILTAKPPRH